jgi:hypothetical protein
LFWILHKAGIIRERNSASPGGALTGGRQEAKVGVGEMTIGRQRPDRLSRLFIAAALLAVAAPALASPQDCSTRSMAQAARAVREAEAAVARAAKAQALWLNAQQALEQARAALAQGEPSRAACAAAEARAFAALGIQQLGYPPYRVNSGDRP